MIVYLIGMPGVGKSTLGKRLARALGFSFLDLDAWIVLREQASIADLFARGEAHFRNCESAALRSTVNKKRLVVATGGGVIVRKSNRNTMRRHGLVICLKRPIGAIKATMNAAKRPLLANDPDRLRKLYDERKDLYRAAAHIDIDCRNRRRAILEMCEVVQREYQSN